MADIMSRTVERTGNDARPLVKVYTKPRLRALFGGFADIEIVQRQISPELVPRRPAAVAAAGRAAGRLEPDHQGPKAGAALMLRKAGRLLVAPPRAGVARGAAGTSSAAAMGGRTGGGGRDRRTSGSRAGCRETRCT